MCRLHRQLAQELAARISLSMDTPASVPSRSAVGHQSVSRTRRPRRLKGSAHSSVRPQSDCRPPVEVSTVQALMDLALPRFVGLGEGPRQVHHVVRMQVVKRTHIVQWTRCQCRRRVSTWICCRRRRTMIGKIMEVAQDGRECESPRPIVSIVTGSACRGKFPGQSPELRSHWTRQLCVLPK